MTTGTTSNTNTNTNTNTNIANINVSKISKKLDNYSNFIISVLEKYGINTPEKIAAFFSQVYHESGGFNIFEENLKYSAERLLVIFPKYFKNLHEAKSFEKNPQKIANRVYSNRMGNGNEESGDGYKFRGRGFIQLTGKDNYKELSNSLNKSIDETINYLMTFEGAFESACWFWDKRKINDVASDIKKVTKLVNGGNIGLNEREMLFNKFKEVLT